VLHDEDRHLVVGWQAAEDLRQDRGPPADEQIPTADATRGWLGGGWVAKRACGWRRTLAWLITRIRCRNAAPAMLAGRARSRSSLDRRPWALRSKIMLLRPRRRHDARFCARTG